MQKAREPRLKSYQEQTSHFGWRIISSGLRTAPPCSCIKPLSRAASINWPAAAQRRRMAKRVGYFSAEFLMGRMIYANLLNLGILEEVRDLLAARGSGHRYI